MKYILDFDRVLFDNARLQNNISEKNIERLFAEPELWDTFSAADYLYDDALSFLKKYPIENLYILTAYSAHIGPHAQAYQTRKLSDSGIAKYVQEVIVMDGAKAPYVADVTKGEPAVFVDDKRKYVKEVHKACPNVTCIQLLRPQAERTKFDTQADTSITIPLVQNLAEVSAIIETI